MNWLSILRFYFENTKGYRLYLFLFFLSSFGLSLESTFYSRLTAEVVHIYDSYYIRQETVNILWYIYVFMFLTLCLEFLHILERYFASKSIPYINLNILNSIYDHIWRMPFVQLKSKPTGEIVSRIKNLRENYDDLIFDLGHDTPKSLFQVITALLALAVVDIKLSLILGLWSTAFVMTMYYFYSEVSKYTYLEDVADHNIINKITDSMLNLQTIFNFSSFKYERNKLQEEYKRTLIPCELKTYKYKILLFFVGGGMYVGIMGYVLWYLLYSPKGAMTIKDITFILGQFMIIVKTLWYINNYIQDVVKEFNAIKTVYDYLNDFNNFSQEESKRKYDVSHYDNFKIEFKDVCFYYDDSSCIVKDFNLKILSGEKIGIVGESGAGKSSLLSLLLGYYNVTSGSIFINDHNMNDIEMASLLQKISFIPQEISLFNRTIMQNIQYPDSKFPETEVYKVCEKLKIHNAILKLPEGYDTIIGGNNNILSGGQKQRIIIARAMLRKTPILLLDEITSALDTQTEASVVEALNILFEELKPTVITVAHKLSTIKNMDKIIVLKNGTIAENGTHEDLIKKKNGVYNQLWAAGRKSMCEK